MRPRAKRMALRRDMPGMPPGVRTEPLERDHGQGLGHQPALEAKAQPNGAAVGNTLRRPS